MAEFSSRLGNFSVIRVGHTVLITPCDTRMKIVGALSKGQLTSDDLVRETGVSYSTVMDHLDFLERLGVVVTCLKRESGRRRIYFCLDEDPLERIEELFVDQASEGLLQAGPPEHHH